MSNYLSSPYSIQQPQSSVDLNVVQTTLQAKQGAYDVNKALIDQTLAMYSSQLKALRADQNQYISAKLKEVTSAIDQFSVRNGDLSYNYNKDSILKAVTNVLQDPIVSDAVESYNNSAKYDSQYQEILKKNPKLANQANYEYGKFQAGYFDYLQGKTKKLGQIQYIPYTDLTEEHLKNLKTIKEVSGKRFIETPDPANPGRMIRKEIDGLEDWQIQQYLGSTMTSQELTQMRIQAWQKQGGVNIENNKASIKRQFDEYNNQKIQGYENQKTAYLAIADNPSYSDSQKTEARRKVNDLTESINDLKLQDSSNLDATSMAFNLERASYINGISQLAKAEWSTQYKQDEAYFASQRLDISRQNLEISRANLGIAQGRLALEQQKAGIGADGKPLQTGVVSQTPFSSTLAETISAEEAGQGTLVVDHNRAYNQVMGEAVNFMNTANEDDVNTVKADLNARGVEVMGNQIRFKNPAQHRNESLANTVVESFKKTGQITPEMYKSNEIKQQKSKELVTVRKEVYPEVFNKNPDTYINSLRAMISGKRTGQLADYYDALTGRPISSDVDWAQAVKAQEFVDRNGGWNNLKTNLQRNPERLNEFADLLADMTKSAYNASDLKKDASAGIETAIQNKTKSGAMMSAYNQFNITNDKVKQNIASKIVDSEIIGGDERFDPKANITVRKQGKDVYLTQRVEAKGKVLAHDISYVVNPSSTLYNELSGYIDLGSASTPSYIQAERDTRISPMKVSIPSYGTSKTGQQTMMYKVENNIPVEAKKAFGIVGGQPGRLATKELASETITNVLSGAGVPNNSIELFKNTVFNNLPAYSIKTVVKQNPANNFRNEFAMEVVDNKGNRNTDGFLGTDKLSYEMKYSMEMYPQVYVLNQLLYSALLNKNNIDQEIEKL